MRGLSESFRGKFDCRPGMGEIFVDDAIRIVRKLHIATGQTGIVCVVDVLFLFWHLGSLHLCCQNWIFEARPRVSSVKKIHTGYLVSGISFL